MKENVSALKPVSSRRIKALAWLTGVGGIAGVLIYFEQIAVIYILSTLGLIFLLILVAFSDLEKVGVENKDAFTQTSELNNQTAGKSSEPEV